MTGSEPDNNLLLQRNQHLSEDFGTGGQHIAGLLPGLFPFEIGNKAACFQNQQAACGQVPGLEVNPAIAVETTGGNIGQLQYGRAKRRKPEQSSTSP